MQNTNTQYKYNIQIQPFILNTKTHMKRFKFVSLMMIAFLMSGTIFAQTADEVIAKHLEAIGGKDNWKKINSRISCQSCFAAHKRQIRPD